MRETYVPKLVKVKKILDEAEDTKILKLNTQIDHQPGQFIELSLLGIGEAPFALCNYEKEDVELCIREVGNLTNAVHNLKEGDKVGIRGPFGNGFPMKEFKGNNLVIVAGGTGLAAVKGVIEYIKHRRMDFRTVKIFLGFRSPDDIIFKKALKQWQKEFRVFVTVDSAAKKWKGNVGVVTSLLDDQEFSNYNTVAITCGPPIMIKFVIQSLKKKGFNDDQIYVSMERLMHCGMMKCGHCMIGGKYVCKDGPVFNYSDAKWLSDG